MTCSCSPFGCAAERQFTDKVASRDLTRYQRKGPPATTRLLRDGLASADVLHGVLLDIGAGIGALCFELLDRGIDRAIAVDASPAYAAAASKEAARRGRSDMMRVVRGDFLDTACGLPAADIVTLDRVVCCYPSYQRLVAEAVEHARRAVGISYPRASWYVRAVTALENARRRLSRNPFRTFVHPARAMEAVIRDAGFRLASRRHTLVWCVDIYVRSSTV